MLIHVDYPVSCGLPVRSRGLSIGPYVSMSPSSCLSFVISVTLRFTTDPADPEDTPALLTSSRLHKVHYLNQFKSQACCWNWFLLTSVSTIAFIHLLLHWCYSSWINNTVVTVSAPLQGCAATTAFSTRWCVVTGDSCSVLGLFSFCDCGGDCGEWVFTRITMPSVLNFIQPTSTINDEKSAFSHGKKQNWRIFFSFQPNNANNNNNNKNVWQPYPSDVCAL